MARTYIRISPLYPFDQKTKGSRIKIPQKENWSSLLYTNIYQRILMNQYAQLWTKKKKLNGMTTIGTQTNQYTHV